MVANPLSRIDASFVHYVERQKLAFRVHMGGNGLPDYAYTPDYELRKKLDAIPNFFGLSKKICATYVSRQMQIINQQGLAVGPNQFPDVYEIGRDCAKRLGIGIPNIYIVNNPELNASTYSMDDVEPLIILNSGMYERFTPSELRVIIGHECGHIHNQHGVYHIMASLLLEGGISVAAASGVSSMLLSPILLGAKMALSAWNRAKEVSADRAGMICCEQVEDAYRANAKSLYGAAFGEHAVDFAELEKQLDMQRSSITRLEELDDGHPAMVRRIAAEKFFAECELFYRWRPDLRTPGQLLRGKEETDALCKKYISVIKE